MKQSLLLAIAALVSTPVQSQTEAIGYQSTDGNYWRMSNVHLSETVVGTPEVVIRSSEPQQTFLGWGTCFNELPWDAYNMMTETEKGLFAKRLFSPYGDLRLQKGRLSVGANDYARDWYSCDEVDVESTDFNMEHFNINRDLTTIIPSIKVALEQNPDIDFFASPWSPPSWMKTNKHYAQRSNGTNGCPFDVPPYFNDQFIDKPEYYQAYCLYFDKFINAYKEQGINITSLAYQNEAYSNTPYPGCSWTAKTTGKFLAEYLGPYMKNHHPELKLILGTMNTASLDVYEQILSTPHFGEYISAVGFQWEGANAMREVSYRHPEYEIIQTESECGSGTFDWNAAEHTFYLVNRYLSNKVTTYYYWNAILADKGLSTWGWQQNALVRVNSATGTPEYTPEYYAYKHYAHLIPAGSKILQTNEKHLLTSALTPEGNIVVIVGNNTGKQKKLSLDIDGKYLIAVLPPNSFTSYIVGGDAGKVKFLEAEARGLMDVEQASLSDEQYVALDKALNMAEDRDEVNCTETLEALASAVYAVQAREADAHDEILNPQFKDGLKHWLLDNVANGGDFRANTLSGKTCWNNWSGSFTSMDIYQELDGMVPGAYTLSAFSMCGPGEITDQHAYLKTQGDVAVSPTKQIAIWDRPEGWEQQTTEAIVVGTNGRLRVGYASTSGGGTKGWFCVTDFTLTRVEEDSEIISSALASTIDRAEKVTDNPQLIAAIAKAKEAASREQQLEALTLLREILLASTTYFKDALDEYNVVVAEAHETVQNTLYDEDARTSLLSLMEHQAELLKEISDEVSVLDLKRELENKIKEVKLTQAPGQNTEFTHLILNAGAEGEEGWELSLTNGDAIRKRGLHYSGDPNNYYFDSYNQQPAWLWYTGHQTLNGLPNGTYVLKAFGRSDGKGVFITAETEKDLYLQEVDKTDDAGQLANDWSEYTIEGIIVTNSTLTIGFTNDFYVTGKQFDGTWFSIDDFRLFYISTDTVNKDSGSPHILPDPPSISVKVGTYDITGRQTTPNSFQKGVYIREGKKYLDQTSSLF